MNRSLLRQLLLYRYRYIGGIILFVVIMVSFLIATIELAPSGISHAEMLNATRSATFDLHSFISESLIDLPYVLLQKASLSLLGLTQLSIALPSLLIATTTGLIFVLMIKEWFKLNVALITGIILITSAPFLTMGHTGTASIMTLFWTSIILLAATNILHKTRSSLAWVYMLVPVLPLSLYTPLMIYPIIAISIAGLLHPHVRFFTVHMPKKHLITAIVSMLFFISPLIWSLVQNPSDALHLTGLPQQLPTQQQLVDQTLHLLRTVGDVTTTSIGDIPQPLFGAATLFIIVLGLMRTIADHYSARSYMIFFWILLIIGPAILVPSTILSFTMPAYLLLAIGIESLIREWYKLFPLNPYARLAGLLPLSILVGGIVIANTVQYFYAHFYSTPTTFYSQKLSATRYVLDEKVPKNTSQILYVKPDEKNFYDLLRRNYPKLSVVSQPQEMVPGTTAIVHDGVNVPSLASIPPSYIHASYRVEANTVLLRTYTIK